MTITHSDPLTIDESLIFNSLLHVERCVEWHQLERNNQFKNFSELNNMAPCKRIYDIKKNTRITELMTKLMKGLYSHNEIQC